jgi:hypothetical protein
MMIKKQWLVLTLMLMILMQTACAPAATSTISANDCTTATSDLKLLTNAEDGYCLLYPAGYSTDVPHYIIINPVTGAGDEPGEAWMFIEMEAAAGRTAAQVADAQIAEAGPGFNISRSDVTVDGKQGVILDGLPGQDSLRKVLIVSNDRLYTFAFTPWMPNTNAAQQPTPLEGLYKTIMDTLHFIPPTKALP